MEHRGENHLGEDLRQRDPDTEEISNSTKSEPTSENLKEPQEVQDSVLDKVADSRTKGKEVKSGRKTGYGWRNLWGLFSRTPKVYPSSILRDVEAAVPGSLPEIEPPESDSVQTAPETNQAALFLAAANDTEFVHDNKEAKPEGHCVDDDAGQNTEVNHDFHDRKSVVTTLEEDSPTERLKIFQSLPYPLEDSPESPRPLTQPEASGFENRGFERTRNESPSMSGEKRKGHRSSASSPVRDSSDTRKMISQDSVELTPVEVKIPGTVELLRKEPEEGHVVPIDILFPAKPKMSIEGEGSDEDPELFSDGDGISLPTGGVHVPPVLSASVVGNFSEGSVRVRGRTYLRRDRPIRGPESEAEPPKSRWKTFFGKKNKKKDKVAKTAEQKSQDEAGESTRTRTSWFSGLRRTLRDRWNRIKGRKRALAAVTPEEKVTKIDEVPQARSSPLRTKTSKSEPILGKSSKSKSKFKRWSGRHDNESSDSGYGHGLMA